MNTKCIVIYENGVNPAYGPKPISFEKVMNKAGEWKYASQTPDEWNTIELICRSYCNGLDLMFAYHTHARNIGCLYLGQWNDGVV